MISVISPSNRPDGLERVWSSLKKQTFTSYEWITITPDNEPEKRKGDFYNLNKAWNEGFRRAKGELVVSIVDYTEFPPDTLEKLWYRYTENPITIFSAVGFQYDQGKMVWIDPRIQKLGLYPIRGFQLEFRLCSIPMAAIRAVGGMDEEYDKVVGNSEKDFGMRVESLGFLPMIDKSIYCNFYKHEPHGAEWDKRYEVSCKLLEKHMKEVLAGKRLKLPYVNWP